MKTTSILCPTHKQELLSHDHNGTLYYKCGTCSGNVISIDGLFEGDKLPNLKPTNTMSCSDVECSICDRNMSAYLYKGVEIDLCFKCSIAWLDPGELEKIAGVVSERLPNKIAGNALDVAVNNPVESFQLADAAANAMLEGNIKIIESAPEVAGELLSGGVEVASGAGDVAVEFILEAIGALLSGF